MDAVGYARDIYLRVQHVEVKKRDFHRFPVHGVEWNVGKRLILENLVDRDHLILARRQEVDPSLIEELQKRANRMLREVFFSRFAPKIWDKIPKQLKHVFETSPVDILVHKRLPKSYPVI